MAKAPDSNSNPVQSLLGERAQFEEWLSKLAASDAPEAVRHRVRADYESRLGRIMEALREHGDAIIADLERLRTSETDLSKREGEALETVAEAELRHTVGEYTDAKWGEISRVQNASLDGIRKELSRVRVEIDRLTEVQESIEGHERKAAAVVEAPPAPARQASAPSAASTKPTPPRKPAPSDDELDFLKSVAVEQSSSLSPQNASDDQPTAEESVPAGSASSPTATAPIAPAAASKSPASGTNQAKTLKCGECGTLNRPTEWYCERCGAELAAL